MATGTIKAVVAKADIANNLTTSTAGKVLDASQGKALKDSVDTINNRWGTVLGNGTNFNSITNPGHYTVYTNQNQPNGSSTSATWGVSVYANSGSTVVKQVAVSMNDGADATYQRRLASGTWSAWESLSVKFSAGSYTNVASLAELKTFLLNKVATMVNDENLNVAFNLTSRFDPFDEGGVWMAHIVKRSDATFSVLCQSYAGVIRTVRNVQGTWTFEKYATSDQIATTLKTELTSGTDLNNISGIGVFSCATNAIAQTLVNCPVSTNFVMFQLLRGTLKTQIIFAGGNDIYTRVQTSSEWQYWYNFHGTRV